MWVIPRSLFHGCGIRVHGGPFIAVHMSSQRGRSWRRDDYDDLLPFLRGVRVGRVRGERCLDGCAGTEVRFGNSVDELLSCTSSSQEVGPSQYDHDPNHSRDDRASEYRRVDLRTFERRGVLRVQQATR